MHLMAHYKCRLCGEVYTNNVGCSSMNTMRRVIEGNPNPADAASAREVIPHTCCDDGEMLGAADFVGFMVPREP